MDIIKLAQEIIDGRRITRDDDLSVFLDCDLAKLCEGADRIREHFVGNHVDLCSIINGRSGNCPEDCKYCAQSAHNHTDCEVYDFLPKEQIIELCETNANEGVHRFSIVTAGNFGNGKKRRDVCVFRWYNRNGRNMGGQTGYGAESCQSRR